MRELDVCLDIRRKITEIDEKISVLRAAILSPKNQVITGMPRSGSSDNQIDRYLIRCEKLSQQKEQKLEQLKGAWEVAENKIPNLTEQEKNLLFLRFVEGCAWKKCAFRMNEKYGSWNINKVFRTYRRILKKV